MALLVRRGGCILCAAMHSPMDGDIYIDDALHYTLAVEKGLIVTLPAKDHQGNGIYAGVWWWKWDRDKPKGTIETGG